MLTSVVMNVVVCCQQFSWIVYSVYYSALFSTIWHYLLQHGTVWHNLVLFAFKGDKLYNGVSSKLDEVLEPGLYQGYGSELEWLCNEVGYLNTCSILSSG